MIWTCFGWVTRRRNLFTSVLKLLLGAWPQYFLVNITATVPRWSSYLRFCFWAIMDFIWTYLCWVTRRNTSSAPPVKTTFSGQSLYSNVLYAIASILYAAHKCPVVTAILASFYLLFLKRAYTVFLYQDHASSNVPGSIHAIFNKLPYTHNVTPNFELIWSYIGCETVETVKINKWFTSRWWSLSPWCMVESTWP